MPIFLSFSLSSPRPFPLLFNYFCRISSRHAPEIRSFFLCNIRPLDTEYDCRISGLAGSWKKRRSQISNSKILIRSCMVTTMLHSLALLCIKKLCLNFKKSGVWNQVWRVPVAGYATKSVCIHNSLHILDHNTFFNFKAYISLFVFFLFPIWHFSVIIFQQLLSYFILSLSFFHFVINQHPRPYISRERKKAVRTKVRFRPLRNSRVLNKLNVMAIWELVIPEI